MARNLAIQHIRTTRANLDTQATANNLKAGELYLITDENRIAIGLTVSTYEVYSKYSETHLLSGNQTVNGIKTFGSFPVTPSSAPTTDYQVANKKYVDDNAGGGSAPDFDIASMSWADVVETGTTLYTSMQQATGITVPTPVLINRSSSSATVSLWVNTSATFTGAKELQNDISFGDGDFFPYMFIPNLYYGFKISGIAEYDSVNIVIVNSKTLSEIDSVYVEHYVEGGP